MEVSCRELGLEGASVARSRSKSSCFGSSLLATVLVVGSAVHIKARAVSTKMYAQLRVPHVLKFDSESALRRQNRHFTDGDEAADECNLNLFC